MLADTVVWVGIKHQRVYKVISDRPSVLTTLEISVDLDSSNLKLKEDAITTANIDIGGLVSAFYWKDAVYFCACGQGEDELVVFNLKNRVCKKAVMGTPHSKIAEGDAGYHPQLLFGDERYLIRMNRRGMSVWCFDKNFPLVKEGVDYKEILSGQHKLIDQKKRPTS